MYRLYPQNAGAQPRLRATDRSGSEGAELSSVRLQRPCYISPSFPLHTKLRMLTMMSDDQYSKQIVVYNPVQYRERKAMDKTASHLTRDGAVYEGICGDSGNCLINLLP